MEFINFSLNEFKCRCCGRVELNEVLLQELEKLRAHFGGKPVIVLSGYRCHAHNAAVGGAKFSQHVMGNAADIYIKGVAPGEVYDYLDSAYPDSCGVGKYQTFTHLDVRKQKARWRK